MAERGVFVTHGEDEVASGFADSLYREYGLRAVAPYPGAVYDLIADECTERGDTKKKPQADAQKRKHSPVYRDLQDALGELQVAVTAAEGYSNRDLKEAAKEIRKIVARLR